MPRFKIRHITRYVYEGPVRDSANQIMLFPLRDPFVDVVHHSVRISGNPPVSIFTDYFGNEVGTFTHSHPHQELTIDSKLEVITRPRAIPTDAVGTWQEVEGLDRQLEYMDFLKSSVFSSLPEVIEVVESQRAMDTTPFATCKRLCTYIYQNFKYKKGITTIESTPDEVWGLKSGVCQDFAQILLEMLRLKGIPARYVSGYICPNTSGMRGEGATHAWVEAYVPSLGWIGLDPTNNCVVNDNHVRLAVGRNFADCSPVRGTYRGAFDHTLEVEVTVSYEDGHQIHDLNKQDSIQTPGHVSVSRNSYRRHMEIQQQQ